jgi:hypothetical protein
MVGSDTNVRGLLGQEMPHPIIAERYDARRIGDSTLTAIA